MAAEEDEGQEDVLALEVRRTVVPAPSRGDGGGAGDAEEAAADGPLSPPEVGGRAGGRAAGEFAAERAGWTAGEAAAEPSGRIAGTTVEQTGPTDGERLLDKNGEAAGLWKDGPLWTVRGAVSGTDAARELAPAERTGQMAEEPRTAQSGGAVAALAGQVAAATAQGGAGWAVRDRTAGLALDGARQAARSRAGLEGLYRQAVRAARPAAPALVPEQAGRAVRAQEPGSTASLAVDELDRAVRRDSRRYDGGMSIF